MLGWGYHTKGSRQRVQAEVGEMTRFDVSCCLEGVLYCYDLVLPPTLTAGLS